MKIAALILAAGTSSRMGTDKQLLPYKGTTLLGWTIENILKCNVDKVFCVLGSNVEKITSEISKYPIAIIYNPNYEKGLSTSIISGIEHIKYMEYDPVLILLADQPNVDSLYINTIISTFELNPNDVIASSYNNIKGVSAIFPKKMYPNLVNIKGDKGAKLLLNSVGSSVITVNEFSNLRDIDTPQDYDKFLKSQDDNIETNC